MTPTPADSATRVVTPQPSRLKAIMVLSGTRSTLGSSPTPVIPRLGIARATCLSRLMSLDVQLFWLLILALPIASVAWTITHEEVAREAREYCEQRSKNCKGFLERKIFYVFTCDYCLSHWVTLFFVLLTGYRLLLDDWRGLLIAVFALVWVANIYMSIFGRLRLGIKAERKEIEIKEEVLGRR